MIHLTTSPKQGASGAAPRDFDYYVLALAWQPEWAASACPGGGRPNALMLQQMNTGSYGLGLHGLWPNYDPSQAGRAPGIGWPQFCNTCASSQCETCSKTANCNFASCERTTQTPKCQIPAPTLAAFNTSGRWQRYAPQYAWGTLAVHEWAKHGSCSPWHDDAGSYFAAAEAGFEAIRNWPSMFWHPTLKLFLMVYVDDVEMAIFCSDY